MFFRRRPQPAPEVTLVRKLLVTTSPIGDTEAATQDAGAQFRQTFHQLAQLSGSASPLSPTGPEGAFTLEPPRPLYTFVAHYLDRLHGIASRLAATHKAGPVETLAVEIFDLEAALIEYRGLLEREHAARVAEAQALAGELAYVQSLEGALDPEAA